MTFFIGFRKIKMEHYYSFDKINKMIKGFKDK